ncbi:MAG: cell wall-binding repeat-containing protein, partial [Desulfitobacterium hafniense]
LNGEITLTFELSAEDLEGIDPASLTVHKVDDSGSVMELGGQYQNGSVTVSTSHLCRFFITGKVTKERLQGPDRYLTAAAISHKGWEQGNDVILASGENYADALTGAVLAGMLDAPVLLTGKDGLNEAVLKEIKRLHAKNIYIIGGTGVVSASAETQLKEAYHVQRLQGVDRYGTAAAVGEKIKEQNSNAQNILDTVILATAQNYPDALAIAPFAAQTGIPILFTAGENLNPVTKQALKDWGIQNVIIAGGTGAIAASVEDELRNSLQIKTERLSGTDRYGTALAIAKHFSPQGNYEGVVVATGESFADALAGASFAAKHNFPVLLTGKTRMDKGVLDYIGDLKIHKVYILGGEGAVPDQVKETIY